MQLIDEKMMELLHTQNRDVSSDKTCDYTVNVQRCNSASCRLATGGTDVRPRTCPNPGRPDSELSATMGGRHQRWVSRVDPTGGKIATFLWTTRAMKQSTSYVATPPPVARHQGAQIYVPTFHVYVPTKYCPIVCITPLWEGDTKGGSLG